jgi:circadian clock protein KaiC
MAKKKKTKSILDLVGGAFKEQTKARAKPKAKKVKKKKAKPKKAKPKKKTKPKKKAEPKKKKPVKKVKKKPKPKAKPIPKPKVEPAPKPKPRPEKKVEGKSFLELLSSKATEERIKLKSKLTPKAEAKPKPKVKAKPEAKPKLKEVEPAPELEEEEERVKPKIKTKKDLPKHEQDVIKAEVKAAKLLTLTKGKKKRKGKLEILKVGVSHFDKLIGDNGLERGSTVLVSGGCGTGKTTFALQSLYYGATHGERGIFVSFEEEVDKIKIHMKKNFGWDFDALEKKGLIKFIQLDPIKVARKVEAARLSEGGELRIKIKPIEMPFVPDRLAVDSLSALSIAFEDEENYRKYIRQLFETFETYNGLTFVLTETEQNPIVYSRAGIEEFLADGVVVLYNIKVRTHRENALEILKLRSSSHEKKLVPYTITKKGIIISLARKLEHETFV